MSWRAEAAVLRAASSGALLLACLSCAEAPPEDPVIAQIGGEPLRRSEFKTYVQAVSEEDMALVGGELKSALLEQLIEERLMLRAANDAGMEVSPEELRALEKETPPVPAAAASGDADFPAEPAELSEAQPDQPEQAASGWDRAPENLETHLKLQKLMNDKILKDIEVTDEEVAAHYEDNRAYYKRPAAVDISQILVETEEEANQLLAELNAHKSRFEDLAREHSIGPEASAGGHLGTFHRGELPAAFENEVFSLGKGKLSGVVRTDFGFHIFRTNETFPAKDLSLDDVSASIRVELLRKKSDEALALYMDGLKKRYPVWIDAEKLEFPYLNRDGYDVRSGREAAAVEGGTP
jgi:peptidyl-prolyl cis-trans isomerase C